MEIVDVAVDFNGSVWENWEEEENSLLKKESSLTVMCKPAIELNGRYASAAKTDCYELSRFNLPIATGSWSAGVNADKDTDGNKSVGVEGSIGNKTEGGTTTSANAGACISSDKDQNITGDMHAGFTVEGTTESGINFSGNINGSVSTNGNSSFSAGLEFSKDF